MINNKSQSCQNRPVANMKPLATLQVALRHSDTLSHLLQHGHHEYGNANGFSQASHQRQCDCHCAGHLRESLSDLNRRLEVHWKTTGETIEESVSTDIFTLF